MAFRQHSLNEDEIFGQLFDDDDEQSEVYSFGYGSEMNIHLLQMIVKKMNYTKMLVWQKELDLLVLVRAPLLQFLLQFLLHQGWMKQVLREFLNL